MPVLVVERLEVVQIQEHQCTKALAALASRHGLSQSIHQQAPVRQIGQAVMKSELANLFLHLLALRDVFLHGQIVRHNAIDICDG